MSLFGGLYVGKNGLQTSQNALNTTAHNLSNLGTPGYVRQQVAQNDLNYTTISMTPAVSFAQTGDGVQYSECRHIRDSFLDAIYREESGRNSFYEVSYSAILELEDILGELDGAAFKDAYEGMWTAFEELSKNPSDTINISLLVQKSAAFMRNATAVYNSMYEYQSNLNTQIKDMVDDINAIGKRIDELNGEIAWIECGGVEHANDLRDERDYLIDTLAGYGNVTYKEGEAGRVSVRFNNVDFVNTSGAYEMKMLQDLDTGFYTPYWPQNVKWNVDADGERVPDYSVAEVFDCTEEISTDKATDVGALRALLLARGNHTANYVDLTPGMMTEKKCEALGISIPEYQSDPEKWGKKYYNDFIANSVVMNAQAEFDNLVHAITTKVNEVLADACDPEWGYLTNPDGTPMQMFVKTMSDPYEKLENITEDEAKRLIEAGDKLYRIYGENGVATDSYWRYKEEDPEITQSLYNCKSLRINQDLVQTPALLGFVREENSDDYNMGKAFLDAFADEEGLYLNPNMTKPSSFEHCYQDYVGKVANAGDGFRYLYECEQLSVQQVDGNRQTVIGVSADEELERMIMYQNAYNASSRYINVINTLLDSLLSIAQ